MKIQASLFSTTNITNSGGYFRDKDIIPTLIDIHAPTTNPMILDVTFGGGVMWKGCVYQPDITLDKRPLAGICGDFMTLPFSRESIDVIVFDPPHLPAAAASVGSSNIYGDRFGIDDEQEYRGGDNISTLFRPFIHQAKRVLVKEGIVLAKIADMTHNHKYHWQHVDFINEVRLIPGLTACDGAFKIDPSAGNLKSNKWVNVKHLRKNHCYWIVVRKGGCECRR